MKQDVFPVGQGARKRRSQWLAFGIFKLLSYSIVLILFAILGFIIYKGIGVISWEFLTTAPSDGMTGGGIWPAIDRKSTRLNSSHIQKSRMPSSA